MGLKIKVEIFDNHHTAMWHVSGPLWEHGIKGCPCGSYPDTVEGSVQDLINRTNMESKTDFKVEDFELEIRDYDKEG